MVLKNPREAVGCKIQWYSWVNTYLELEDVDLKRNYVLGTQVTNVGPKDVRKAERYNLCSGISIDEKIPDHWHIIEPFKSYRIEDELFEI